VADVAVVEVPGEEEPVVARAGAWDFPLETLPAGARIRVALPLRPGLRGELQLGLAGQARRRYDRDDRAFARRVAAHAGVVLERSRLREAEHEIALRLQRALLPDRVVRHPALEIAARYEAASGVLSVGGDWYDTFALPGGRVGLAVGDVVGHGLEAAAAMGRLRTALAALAPHADGPGRLLALLNEFAAGPNGSDFVTACCATLDPATGALRYASAGHPPMLLVAPGGATRWLGAAASPPLRFGLVSERPEASAVLEPGAALVLYSDGLVERRREPIDAGLARLERAARAGHADPAEALCDRIVAALGVDAARDDDVVVLCVRRTGRER